MNGGWVKGREGMREERGSKGQRMEGDEGEGKLGTGREENGEERGKEKMKSKG